MPRTLTRRAVLASIISAPIMGVGFYAVSGEDIPKTNLSPTEAHIAIQAGDIILIDVRQPQEWNDTGVAPGARLIDMRRTDFITQIRKLRDENPDTPIGFICARGVRSHNVSTWAAKAGIGNLIDIPEGMLGSRAGPGWLGRGLPVIHPSSLPDGGEG